MDLEVLVDATLGVIATLMLLPAMIMMGFMTVQLAYDTRSLMIAG